MGILQPLSNTFQTFWIWNASQLLFTTVHFLGKLIGLCNKDIRRGDDLRQRVIL
jgi:hypothetical protein